MVTFFPPKEKKTSNYNQNNNKMKTQNDVCKSRRILKDQKIVKLKS